MSTAAELQAKILAATPAMNEMNRMVETMLIEMATKLAYTVKVVYVTPPRHGKRARRAAFYARRRSARALEGVMGAVTITGPDPLLQQAYADQVRTGTGFYTFRTPA